MAVIPIQVKVSVMDTEPMNSLVNMLVNWDLDKLPPEYKAQLKGWMEQFKDGEPDEPAKVGKDQLIAEKARSTGAQD